MQADVVPAIYLSECNRKWAVLVGDILGLCETLKPTFKDLVQQDYTYYNKAIPSNRATTFGNNFLSIHHML